MKDLKRSDLEGFAHTLIVANTPVSLLRGLLRAPGMTKLKACPAEQLQQYFDHITARPRRSAVSIGLAYAVLSALLSKAVNVATAPVDAGRLEWGKEIRDFMALQPNIKTGTIIVSAIPPRPSVQSTLSASGSMFMPQPPNESKLILDANGTPYIWRNND